MSPQKNELQAFSLLFSTATNSSTPACSPVLRKRSRSATPQLSPETDGSMVEKGSPDQAPDRSPTTSEQQQTSQHQRTYSQSVHPTNTSTRSGGKNSKVSGQTQALASH